VEGNSKIGKPDISGLGSQDVCSLEVVVHNIALVKIPKPFEYLYGITGDEALIEFTEGFESLL